MAARTGNVKLHAPAGLGDLTFAAALRAGARRFDKSLTVAVGTGIAPGNIQAHHPAADGSPERYVDLILEIGPRFRTFLCRSAAAAENTGKNIAKAARAGVTGFPALAPLAALEHVGKIEAAEVEVAVPRVRDPLLAGAPAKALGQGAGRALPPGRA